MAAHSGLTDEPEPLHNRTRPRSAEVGRDRPRERAETAIHVLEEGDVIVEDIVDAPGDRPAASSSGAGNRLLQFGKGVKLAIWAQMARMTLATSSANDEEKRSAIFTALLEHPVLIRRFSEKMRIDSSVAPTALIRYIQDKEPDYETSSPIRPLCAATLVAQRIHQDTERIIARNS